MKADCPTPAIGHPARPMRPTAPARHRGWSGPFCLVGLVLASAVVALAAADGSGPRVSLLSSGSRASIVIELDGDGAKATAIEATDSQSVAVEIGPVRGKVANQRLKADESSAIVSEVRVRGVTQGDDGTVITIQILAKAPVSGSVRRSARRVYIDLERRDGPAVTTRPDSALSARTGPASTVGTAPPAKPTVSAAPGAAATASAREPSIPPTVRAPAPSPAPVGAQGSSVPRPETAARAAQVTPPVQPAAVAPTAPPAPATARVTPAPSTRPETPSISATAATAKQASGAAPIAVLPPPPPAAGSLVGSSAPSTSTPGPRPAATSAPPPSPAPGPPAAAVGTASAVPARNNFGDGNPDELLRQASVLASQSDVKGLERLRLAAMARLGDSATEADALNDPAVQQLDRYLNDARQQRLLADAQLFRTEATRTDPSASGQKSPSSQQPPASSPSPAASRSGSSVPLAAAARQTPAPSPATPPKATGSQTGTDAVDAAVAEVLPDVERMRDTLQTWQPGYLAAPSLPPQIDELRAKLARFKAPAALTSSVTGLTTALTDLSGTWVPGPDGKLIPFRDDVKAVERARTAIGNFIDAVQALKLSSRP